VLQLLIFLPKTGLVTYGKSLRLSAWVRSGGYTGDSFRILAVSSDSANGIVAIPPSPAGGWTQYEVTTPIDARDVANVAIRLMLVGNGTVWVDDLELQIDGVRVDSLVMAGPPTDAQREWLKRSVVSLEPKLAGPARLLDLEPLRSLMASAKVVGVGESTHGTLEFGQLRRDVIEYAAQNLGIHVVAMEESQLTAAALNRWIHGASGQLRPLLENGLYPGARRAESAALFEWMRQYNATAAHKLDFVGVDMANVLSEIDSVRLFLERHDPEYVPIARQTYDTLRAIWRTRGFGGHTRESMTAWRDGAARVHDHMRARRATYAAAVGDSQVTRMVQYADAVQQGAILLLTSPNDLIARDSMMATNLVRELTAHGPDARAVLFAHSMHVGRQPRRMGDFLNKAMGEAYVPMTSVSYEGMYLAGPPSLDPFELGGKVEVPLGPGFVGSIEEMLHRVGGQRLGLDLKRALRQPEGRWLADPWYVTFVGAAVVDVSLSLMPISRWWDGVLFLDRTTAAKYVPCTGVPVPLCWR
jgi:erythromycin esterase